MFFQFRFKIGNNYNFNYNYNFLKFKSIGNIKINRKKSNISNLNSSPFLLKNSNRYSLRYHIYSTHAFKESLPPHLKEFKVTGEACDQLKILKEKFPNKILRLSVETGGCHGFQYKFALEQFENLTQDDLLFEEKDRNKITEEISTRIRTDNDIDSSISIICDRISFEILKSARLDYSRELIGSAFQIVDNPAAASGCGCGVSFDLKEKAEEQKNK